MSSTTATLGEFRDEKDLQISQLKAENKELTEENEKLKEKLTSREEETCVEFCPWLDKVDKLEEENEELKAELNDFVSVFDGNTSMKKMKEENEKLKAEEGNSRQEVIEALAEKFYAHYKKNDYNMLNVHRTIGPDLGRMVDALMKETEELETKIDRMQAEMAELTESSSSSEEEDYRVYEWEQKKEQKVVESTVNMDAFQKLKDDGMMPWVK